MCMQRIGSLHDSPASLEVGSGTGLLVECLQNLVHAAAVCGWVYTTQQSSLCLPLWQRDIACTVHKCTEVMAGAG